MLEVATRLAAIRERIAAAVARRGPGREVVLVGAAKHQADDAVRAAHAAGLRDFAENYAQALAKRRTDLADLEGVRWHFIGALQRNKVKLVTGSVVHGIDRVALLAPLDERAVAADRDQEVLVEVNLGEAQKAGVALAELPTLLDAFESLRRTRCIGLMVVPPEVDDPEATRPHFRNLRAVCERERARTRPNVDLRELSMGMSADYEVAIEEGATLVRVGTALFGPRV